MNTLDNLIFPNEFFLDEVRGGFFVSETMKHFWAAQLKVLSEIDRICRAHDINWYADCGTLLGTVRHKGFIPWDDDIDIAMLREDYEAFRHYAKNELPQGYYLLSAMDNDEFRLPFGRVANSHAVRTNKEFLRENYGCAFVAGVDIFPLDRVYTDSQKEEERKRRAAYVLDTFKGAESGKLSGNSLQEAVERIENDNGIQIDRNDLDRQLLILFDDICKECTDEMADEIASMYEWAPENKAKYPKAFYESFVDLPFESTLLRVPAKYEEVLETYYGDYRTVVKGTAVHDYPVYRAQETEFREKTGVNPGRFSFAKSTWKPADKRKTIKDTHNEMYDLLEGLHEKIDVLERAGRHEECISLYGTCQNAAVSIGETLEARFKNAMDVISSLEQYCETIYEVSCLWNSETILCLNEHIKMARQKTNDLYDSNGKDILFLPCRAKWWNTMRDVFAAAVSNPRNTISVIPIPYFYFDCAGDIQNGRTDSEFFAGNNEVRGYLTGFTDYKLEKRHPDVIVIQVPYDGYGRALTTSNMLFSKELRKYTDELCYVPCFDPEPPFSSLDVANAALSDLVEQSAVFSADRVIVGSSGLRTYYIDKLVQLTGENNKEYWDDRIRVKDDVSWCIQH